MTDPVEGKPADSDGGGGGGSTAERYDTAQNPSDCAAAAAEQCDENDEEVVTLDEALRRHEDAEKDADSVFGDDDADSCSYPDGYKPRQALYACLTCTGKENPAALCLACSIHCHEDHELIEMYTKRRTCCDCGNAKFGQKECRLYKDKAPSNVLNSYNHNYWGAYCRCERPFPDPENLEAMIQCVLCEDWFHLTHIGAPKSTVPDDSGDLVCELCAPNLPLLSLHGQRLIDAQLQEDPIEVKEESSVNSAEEFCWQRKQSSSSSAAPHIESSALWLKPGWRRRLCRCTACKSVLLEAGFECLLEEEDSLEGRSEKARKKREETAKSADDALERWMTDGRNRDGQQIFVEKVTEFRRQMGTFLDGFARNGAVVRTEDVQRFFDGLKRRSGGQDAVENEPKRARPDEEENADDNDE